jgi:hypothetical protein
MDEGEDMARNDGSSKGKKPKTPARAVKQQISGASVSPSGPPIDVGQQERRRLIAEAAYYRAQQRGFSGGDPVRDWLEAEAEVSVRLSGGLGRADQGFHVSTGNDTAGFEVGNVPKRL